LPQIPVLVRVEIRRADGAINRAIWDAEAVLVPDQPEVSLSTNRVTLRNGLGSALVTFSGGSDFRLIAAVNGLQAVRPIQSLANVVPTPIAGTLAGTNTAWSGVILVTNDVIVPAGHALTILPNTLVLVNGVASGSTAPDLEVRGALFAEGTEDAPITITCANPGLRWGQIRHTDALPSLYRHTTIAQAGRAPGEGHTSSFGGPAIRPSNSRITFEWCSISDISGKVMQAGGCDLTFRDCLMTRSIMGPEISDTALLCTNTWFMEMHSADDADGIYLHAVSGKEIRLAGCVFAYGDDDAIDTLDSTVEVEDCIVRGWLNPNEDAKGISVFNGATHIRRCLIADCLVGVSAKWSGGNPTRVTIDRSTIVGRTNAVSAAWKSNAPGPYIDYRITNSILQALEAVHTDFGPTNFSIGYCVISSGWPGTGNLAATPLFVNATTNFHLLPNSPGIDAGNPTSLPDEDGTRADAGAYPFLQLTNPPLIGTQPRSQSAERGTTITLSVTATGAPPLAYRWRFNEADLAGATNSTLTLTNAQTAQSGNYAVIILNGFGAITSQVAVVTVFEPPVSPPPAGVIINEIMYHPASENVREEYLELYNRGGTNVNLKGWRFSQGVRFTFPDVALAAGGYLVIAADITTFTNKYPGVTNVVGNWDGILSNSRQDLDLDDALGQRVDSVRYADEGDWAVRQRGPLDLGHRGWIWFAEHDGMGKSAELIGPHLSNNYGQNWASCLASNGTPGRPNSVFSTNIPPMLLDTTHSPLAPRSSEAVRITTRVVDEVPRTVVVRLHYRVDGVAPPPFATVPMSDDGQHSDGAAGDGLYGAIVPPQTNNSVVEFYLEAADEAGNRRTWPGAAQQADGSFAQTDNLLYQVDDTEYRGAQPLYRMIMTEAERAELAVIGSAAYNAPPSPPGESQTDAQMNGTFISVDGTGAELRYLVGIRNRGHGTRNRKPNNYRINFRSDCPWKGVTALNLNAQYSWLQHLGAVIALRAGVAGGEARAVQVRVNNADLAYSGSLNRTYGSYVANEVLNSDFAERHFPFDSSGNIYRSLRDLGPDFNADLKYRGEDYHSYTNNYFKKTNISENDWGDLIELSRVLSETPDAQFTQEVQRVANIEQWLGHLALMAIFNSRETGLNTGDGDDFAMYRGVQDSRFVLLFYDLDTILGEGSSAGVTNATIFGTSNGSVFGFTDLPVLDRLVKWPDFAPRYYGALKRLCDTTFSAEQFSALAEQTLGSYVPAAVLSRMKTWVAGRTASIQALIPLRLAINSNLSLTNGYFRTTNAVVTLFGAANAIQTRSVLVNGQGAIWTAWQARWTNDHVALEPGLNRITVQALDAEGREIERGAIDIWHETGTTSPLAGALVSDTTLSAAGGPYLVAQTLVVPEGVTLTVQPGATVYFQPGTGLTIRGRLLMEGTTGQRIRLSRRPGASGSWGGLRLENSAQDNRISYVDCEFAETNPACIYLENSKLQIEETTWRSSPQTIIAFVNSSLRVRRSMFAGAANHIIHGRGMLPADSYLIVEWNVFGPVAGENQDAVNYARGAGGEPMPQFLNNVFQGGGDEALDLYATGAYVEGNVFMNFHKATGSDPFDASHAIAIGAPGGTNTNITIARNIFVNNDRAVLLRDGAFATIDNNTMAGCVLSAVNFHEPGRNPPSMPGLGAVFNGDIFWDNAATFEKAYTNHPLWGSTTVIVNFSLAPAAEMLRGTGNRTGNPRFANAPHDLRLRPGSPAIGTGPNGLDMGAWAPPGASITGVPPSPTSLTSATLTVGGPGITHYKFRLDTGPYGEEIPVTAPIVLTNLTSGSHTVYVIGKNSAGGWQSETNPTMSRTWLVNPALSPLIINEVLARNVAAVNHAGMFPDMIELYNGSNAVIDLTGLRLTDDPNDPNKFIFPAGSTLAARSYLVLYANGPDRTTGRRLGFALNQNGDGVYLFDQIAKGGALLDSIEFGLQLADLSVGRLANGTWGLTRPTFGADNLAAEVGDAGLLRINEWLTDGQAPFVDDFIELYNPDPLPVALGGMALTDQPIGAPNRHVVVQLSFIAGNGFRVFIADGDADNGADHVGFRLAPEQGEIALFGADHSLIDHVIYGPQRTGNAQGRSPNGAGAYFSFDQPTPGAGNPVPVIGLPPRQLQLVGFTNEWRYNQSGMDLGTAWSATDYDDGNWPAGAGVLGFPASEDLLGIATLGTPLSLFASNGTVRIRTFYFRTRFVYTNSMAGVTLTASNLLDDGAVFYLNGREAGRIAMASGAVDWQTRASRADDVEDHGLEPLTLAAEYLAPGTNVLAVEVHQGGSSSSDVIFGLTLDALIVTNPPAQVGLVINEVMANNTTLIEPDGSVPDWIELYNPSTNTVDLGDMSLSDDMTNPRRWIFPAGAMLPGRAFYLLRCDGGTVMSATNTGFGLKATGGSVYLFNKSADGSRLLDAVSYGIQPPDWTIGRVPDGISNWTLNLPTLGANNRPASLGSPQRLRINEWMAASDAGEDWFEIVNTDVAPVDLGGLFLSDNLSRPTQFAVPSLSFLGVGANGFQKIEADNQPDQGANHVNFKLSASGESLGISTTNGWIDAITFGPQQSGVAQGRLPDGDGIIVSFANSATPGESNYLPLINVVINEVLTHAVPPMEQAIELYNDSPFTADISGWFLSDSADNLKKYQLPAGSIIPPAGYKVFYQYQFGTNTDLGPVVLFVFNAARDGTVYLSAADAAGNLTGYRSIARFGPAPAGIPFGRHSTSVGQDFVALSRPTFGVDEPRSLAEFRAGTGAANAYPVVGPVVINELMYHPPGTGSTNSQDNSLDEYIELHNVTGQPVQLLPVQGSSRGWRLGGGVSYSFTRPVTVPAWGYVVVVSFDGETDGAILAGFRARYGIGTGVEVVGPYVGKLSNGGDEVALYRLEVDVGGGVVEVLVEGVRYSDVWPWPVEADGLGYSLQRREGWTYGNDPANWTAALPTPGRSNSNNSSLDSDGDHIPDAWESAHGLDYGNPSDAAHDPDGDGLTNLQEYLAGTDPRDLQSTLKLHAILLYGNSIWLQFTAAAGKSYTVQYRDSLGAGAWLKLKDIGPVQSSGPVEVTDPTASASRSRYYRVITPASP
jgi:hypothetical protein